VQRKKGYAFVRTMSPGDFFDAVNVYGVVCSRATEGINLINGMNRCRKCGRLGCKDCRELGVQ